MAFDPGEIIANLPHLPGVYRMLNAADEVAVEAFLAGRISFPGIAALIAETLERVPVREARSVGEVLEIDRESRAVARGIMEKGKIATTEAALRM